MARGLKHCSNVMERCAGRRRDGLVHPADGVIRHACGEYHPNLGCTPKGYPYYARIATNLSPMVDLW